MTNRHVALTVFLEEPVRDDDLESIIDAISMIRKVSSVEPVSSDPNTEWASKNAKCELRRKIFDILR